MERADGGAMIPDEAEQGSVGEVTWRIDGAQADIWVGGHCITIEAHRGSEADIAIDGTVVGSAVWSG